MFHPTLHDVSSACVTRRGLELSGVQGWAGTAPGGRASTCPICPAPNPAGQFHDVCGVCGAGGGEEQGLSGGGHLPHCGTRRLVRSHRCCALVCLVPPAAAAPTGVPVAGCDWDLWRCQCSNAGKETHRFTPRQTWPARADWLPCAVRHTSLACRAPRKTGYNRLNFELPRWVPFCRSMRLLCMPARAALVQGSGLRHLAYGPTGMHGSFCPADAVV